jgi:peptidoglycan lytic transglycosylase
VARARAVALEQKALDALPKEERKALEPLTPEEELIRVKALLGAGQDDAAEDAADAAYDALPAAQKWTPAGCEILLVRAKAIAEKRERGRAADSLADAVARCKGDPEQHARILYLAGKYAALDGRHAQAAERYLTLEKLHPTSRLADDARVNAAFSYFELGSEARFTELLSGLPDDYPDGDMVLDGVFRLAMRRIEKGDWSGAASVLDRAAALVGDHDNERGTELSGRERYFRARAWIETGESERGLAEYEAIVRDDPLSYYMLHAWSRLLEKDPARARAAREQAMERAASQPFTFEHRPEFEEPGFVRAMELLRQGDVDRGKREIRALGLMEPGASPAVLWGVALLYERAGAAKLSHGVARGLLTDWLSRWPAGDWVKAWEIAYPRPHRGIVERESKRTGVPESLIYGVMREESAFDPEAVSPADAFGLMQLIVPTAKLYARPLGLPYDSSSLRRPGINIRIGTQALAKLLERFDENPLLTIPGYNAGPGRPTQWLRDRPNVDFDVWVELIPYSETRRYVRRVLSSRAAYAVLYDAPRAQDALVLPERLGS